MVKKIDSSAAAKIIEPQKSSGSLKGRSVQEVDSELTSISKQLGARVYDDPEISKIYFKAEKASESGDLETLKNAVDSLRVRLDSIF